MRTIARRTRPVAVVLSALLLVASGVDDQASDAHHATGRADVAAADVAAADVPADDTSGTADARGHDAHG